MLWRHGVGRHGRGPQSAAPLIRELHAVQRSMRQRCALAGAPDIHALTQEVSALAVCSEKTGHDERVEDAGLSRHYVAAEEHLESLVWSRWIMNHADLERIRDRRRGNYQRWVDAVEGLPHCEALRPQLQPSCIPYMFPLWIACPEIHFFALKRLGVPVWRWDEMAISDCQVAEGFRLHLLHLPCHQELTSKQMSWMTSAVQQVMRQLPIHHETAP